MLFGHAGKNAGHKPVEPRQAQKLRKRPPEILCVLLHIAMYRLQRLLLRQYRLQRLIRRDAGQNLPLEMALLFLGSVRIFLPQRLQPPVKRFVQNLCPSRKIPFYRLAERADNIVFLHGSLSPFVLLYPTVSSL